MKRFAVDKNLAFGQPEAARDGQAGRLRERAAERALQLGPGLQALWQTLLPLVGALPAQPGESPGIFNIEAGPGDHEATVHIDMPPAPYQEGEGPVLDRVLSLSVKLAHDYRKFGEDYYCVDCDIPVDETRH
ncbi:MAG: hypothetical protein VCA74_05735 [Deltaproteobacteria bacterium]